MMKGLMFQVQQQQQQLQQQVVEENMSNLTSASGEASVSSGNRTEIGNNYSQQYFAPPPTQTQPVMKKKRNLPGNPDPEAEVIALSPKTLMATNRFICEICNKGFQRDQNLQLHRRGHNLPWKLKQRTSKEIRKKVYVCPEPSCVHHDPSRALGDLTGIKKHFCRKHGEKKWKCDKCSKRYAVQSDWKAHSKTCGTREYRCDCGTLFSRRDSFITHRAFCDALAEESARAITTNNPLLSSQPGSSTPHILNLPQHQYNPQDLHAFTLKKEQQSFNLRPEIPPWLSFPGPPPPQPLDLSSSSSSIFSTRLDHHNHHQEFTQSHQDFSLHETPNPNPSLGPTLPPYQSVPSPHMSATALLQKAAQMGATMSSKTGSSSQGMMLRPTHQAHMSAASDSSNNTTGNKFGLNLSSHEEMGTTSTGFTHSLAVPFGNKAACSSAASAGASTTTGVASSVVDTPSFLHDMVSSLSSATGFEGTSFEDAFGGILNSKKTTTTNSNNASHFTRNDESGTGGGEGLTRDFLGLRALSHGDILSIAGLGHCMNTSNEHQNQPQKPWKGIVDLKSGKIVTPLPPKTTFLDDPLRVLRAIRFGARFGFLLDEELKEAASCDEVKDALAAKISRERIGVEIDLMLSGIQPVKAMTYICDLMLFWIVFTLPPKFEPAKSEGCDRFCIGYLDATWSLIQLIGDSTFNDEQRRLSLYTALFLPFRKTIYKDNKAKKIPVVNYIFRESLKRKASDAETVLNLHSALDKFLSLIPFLVSDGNIQPIEVNWGRGLDDVPLTSKLRVLTGLLLREIKDFWRVTLLLSALLYPTEVDCTEDFPKQHFQLDKQRDLFEAVESAIAKLGLEKVWDVKPLVNGKDIMSVLQLKAGGPLIRVWQQKLLAWQLAHPDGTAEECTDWMRQSHSKRVKTE